MGVRLTRSQAVALNRLTASPTAGSSPRTARVLRVEPEADEGTYTLHSTSIVGSVQIGDTQISIVPKAGVGKTAFMLGYALGDIQWRRENVWQATGDLIEALVQPFLEGVELLVGEGLGEAYVWSQENGNRPRGAIDFSWTGVGMPLPVRYSFDDFSVDTPENRTVRAALIRILSVEGLALLGGDQSMQLLDAFQGVGSLKFDDLEQDVRDHRYAHVLSFARMILDNAGIEPASGAEASRSLLFDMNTVFENFLCQIVVEHFGSARQVVDLQGRRVPRFLGSGRQVRVHPDFSIWADGRCRLVGDVKYKLLNESLRRSDLYQSVAYSLATGAKAALLLYAGSGPQVSVEVPSTNSRITAVPINLEGCTGNELVSSVTEAVQRALESELVSAE